MNYSDIIDKNESEIVRDTFEQYFNFVYFSIELAKSTKQIKQPKEIKF